VRLGDFRGTVALVRRSLIVALLSVVVLVTSVAGSAPATSVPPDDAPVAFGDDVRGTLVDGEGRLELGASTVDVLTESWGAFAGFAEGHLHLGIGRAYTVRIATDHPNWPALQAPVDAAARRLSASTGARFTVGAPTSSASSAGEIVVSFSSGNRCGPLAAGCASWIATSDSWSPIDGRQVWKIRNVDVWISPSLSGKPLNETVLHEFGHAGGLGHYDATFDGTHQVMRSYIDAADSLGDYQNGDNNGLANSAANGFAGGFVIGRPCLSFISDVRKADTFCSDISWLVRNGISTGYADGTFRPTNGLSRQAMSAFLYEHAGAPPVPAGAPGFTDIPPGFAFQEAISWMAAAGITGGFDDGTFRPSVGLSRQAMASFLYRMAGAPAVGAGATTFSDVPPGSKFADAISWMSASGITDGFADGTFRPTAGLSRQAMSAFLHRYDAR